MADVIIELSPRASLAVSHPTADLMASGPHHLSVVANMLQVVSRISIREVSIFKEPRLNCEEPGK